MPAVKRSLKNPLLWPNREHPWEAEAAFNGSVAMDETQMHMVYRAESSTTRVEGVDLRLSSIGHAVSRDGLSFTKREQLIKPEHAWEKFGCEDPRITKFGDKYYIFYTALSKYPFGAEVIQSGVGVTKDFKTIQKHQVTPFNSKAMALFPGKVGGRMAALVTANTDQPPAKIGIALFNKESDIWSEDYWDIWYHALDAHVVPLQRSPNDHIELGAPPIETDEGWVIIYSYIRNYFSGTKIFGIEAALLDKDDPTKIIGRTDRPIMIPEEEYELYGRVPNIVFPTGAVVKKGIIHLYYGAADTSCCVATHPLKALMDEMQATSVKLARFEGNPIITPNAAHAWESKAVFNPGVVQSKEGVHILYRAMSEEDTSVLGYAFTRDGVHIDERLPDPVYAPRESFEKRLNGGGSGCEDPRLTVIGDTIYMCYTAYDGTHPPRIAMTSIAMKDFLAKKWNWASPELISPPDIDDKDAAFFPKKINGKYAILHRIGVSVWIDFVSDLKFEGKQWLGGNILMKPRMGLWDSRKIGISGPPIETKDGWLLLYHGISKREDHHYHVRAALLDLKDPTKVLARTKYAIFEPETAYERDGLVPNVVFPCGSAILDGKLYVYYGGADKVVGVATVGMRDLLNLLQEEREL